MTNITAISFPPLVPWPLIAGLGIVAALLLVFAIWRRAAGGWFRALAFAIGLLALANPSLIEEERDALNDVAVVVIDESPSQEIGERTAQAAAAEAELRERLGRLDNLDVRVVRAGKPASADAPNDDGTRLFEALQRALSDTPRERVAGAILVTDGQVHDVPSESDAERIGGPVHVLLTGAPDERDRRLVIEQAPTYGIVGHDLTLTVKIEDSGGAGNAAVTMQVEGEQVLRQRLAIGQSHQIPFKLEHGGPTILELEVEPADPELTLQNNRAVVVVNGVRDRLRVLLVTGEPHAGERVWRNLLKADPSVDLVHFTILRPPEKQDGTPIRELSLIAFPIRELFELKLDEFDLIIFDRYRRRGILPGNYLENISTYVQNGGALLESSGPAFAGPMSLYRSALGEILPGRPTGAVQLEGFRPHLTETGQRHPVTADLPGAAEEPPGWGRWFRLVEVEARGGQTLMAGLGERPALLLDRVGEGRVAQLLSDHSWLWSRGFEGGGPQAELLRRVAFWLMKEPDLEEDSLRAAFRNNRLEIERRSLEPDTRPVTVTRPDGSSETVDMTETGHGRATAAMNVRQPGLYRLTDGERSTIAAVGAVNPKEFADVRATPTPLAPVTEATEGAARWLADGGVPDIRRVNEERDTYGRNWLGLVAHNDYIVTGVRQIPLLPALAVLALLLGTLLFAWRREGR